MDYSLTLASQIASMPWTCTLNDRRSVLNGVNGGESHLHKAMAFEFQIGMESLRRLQEEGGISAFLDQRGGTALVEGASAGRERGKL